MSSQGAVAYSTLFKGLLAGIYDHEASHHVDLMLWYQQALSILVLKNSKKMSDLERWAINLNEFGQRVIGAKILSLPLIPLTGQDDVDYLASRAVPEVQPTVIEYDVNDSNVEKLGNIDIPASKSLIIEAVGSSGPDSMDFDALFRDMIDANSWDSSIFQSIGPET